MSALREENIFEMTVVNCYLKRRVSINPSSVPQWRDLLKLKIFDVRPVHEKSFSR